MNIAIDLGGTQLRAALVEEDRILRTVSERTLSGGDEGEVLRQLFRLISELLEDGVQAIGVGVPAIVEPGSGIVRDVVAIPSWKEVHLKEILEERFSLPVAVNNDSNCFALGVSHYGEAAGYANAVCVTVGTGIGTGIVVDGRLYGGANLGAGELGNAPYLDRDYEFYCSSRFFESRGLSGCGAAELAAGGDKSALALWEEFGEHLGHFVSLLCYAYDPQIIVLGGSISKAYSHFSGAMTRSFASSFLYSSVVDRLKIAVSAQEGMALLGASLIARTE